MQTALDGQSHRAAGSQRGKLKEVGTIEMIFDRRSILQLHELAIERKHLAADTPPIIISSPIMFRLQPLRCSRHVSPLPHALRHLTVQHRFTRPRIIALCTICSHLSRQISRSDSHAACRGLLISEPKISHSHSLTWLWTMQPWCHPRIAAIHSLPTLLTDRDSIPPSEPLSLVTL